MKTLTLIARILLGFVFTVFGLNGFFHFLPMPPMPGQPGEFFGILFSSHYYVAIFACQVVGGVLLLLGQFVPLGLVILGPILVNILLFHFCIAHQGFPVPIFVTILWFIVFFGYRSAFQPLFRR